MLANIAVLISGGGTNLQALINAKEIGLLESGEIKLVISSNPDAYGLKRAKKSNIDTYVISKKTTKTHEDFEKNILKILEENNIDLIVLAGFMSILSKDFTNKYPNRIINVHPSLIPAFCGEGYYGIHVHERVLEYGVKVSGATVHYVNEIPDGGEIILQKAVNVKVGDTPEILQKRIMKEAEWNILPEATELVCKKLLSKKGQ